MLWSPLRSYVLARSWMDCWFTNVLPNPNKQQSICVNLTQMHSQCMLTLDLLHSSRSPGCRTGLCLHMFSGLQVCHLVAPLEPPWLETSQNVYLFCLWTVFFNFFITNSWNMQDCLEAAAEEKSMLHNIYCNKRLLMTKTKWYLPNMEKHQDSQLQLTACFHNCSGQ